MYLIGCMIYRLQSSEHLVHSGGEQRTRAFAMENNGVDQQTTSALAPASKFTYTHTHIQTELTVYLGIYYKRYHYEYACNCPIRFYCLPLTMQTVYIYIKIDSVDDYNHQFFFSINEFVFIFFFVCFFSRLIWRRSI